MEKEIQCPVCGIYFEEEEYRKVHCYSDCGFTLVSKPAKIKPNVIGLWRGKPIDEETPRDTLIDMIDFFHYALTKEREERKRELDLLLGISRKVCDCDDCNLISN